MTEGAHLVRRFFGHFRARPLSPGEQDRVREVLPDDLASLFFRQHAADQRHAYIVARRVQTVRPDDRDALIAALLHDVGKSAVAIGAIERSLATVLHVLHVPLPRRWRRYREHGELGAAALESAAAPALAVAFARHHPGAPPPGIDPELWADLSAADHT